MSAVISAGKSAPPSRLCQMWSILRSVIGRRETRQEDWNNIPTRPAKVSEKPDISKLSISRVCTTLTH